MLETEVTGIEATDEDDQVIVPAAPLSTLGYGMEHRPGYGNLPKYRQLENRRTTIPVLLTTGLIFLIIPVFKFIVDEESTLALLLDKVWFMAVVILIGLALLGLGIMSMLHVQSSLKEQQKPGA